MSDRPATISPSQLNPLMAKSGLGSGAETFADKLIMRMLGVELDEYTDYNMRWGNENEPNAIAAYEAKTMNGVAEKQRIYHPEYPFVSGEPDGLLLGEDGIIEVKCPKCKWHLANLRNGEQISKYYNQIQGYLWITGRQWADFVSYDPRFPKEMRLAIHRVERDQETIDLIEERSIEFWQTMVIPRAKEFNIELEMKKAS